MREFYIWGSVNETCSFYFEPLMGSGRPGYTLMSPYRMNEIFDICLSAKNVSMQNINNIKRWKVENGY